MSAELRLALAADPLDRAVVDVAIVGWHAGERPLSGPTARADWRLCGRLSALIESGRLADGAGQAALLPTTGGLRAPLVLALGLAPRGALDAPGLRGWSEDAVARSLALRASSIGLLVPGADGLEVAERVDGVVQGAAQAWGKAAVEDRRCLAIALVPPPEAHAEVAEHLRWLADQPLPERVCVEAPEAGVRRVHRAPPRDAIGSARARVVK